MNSYLEFIKDKLKDNFDVKFRTIQMINGKAVLIFVDNLCDSKFISEYIITPLTISEVKVENIEDVETKVLYSNNLDIVKNGEDAIMHIISGDVVIVFDFLYDVIFCEAKGYAKRSITIPQTEAVVKGPREGFTESFVDNVALIRRKVKNPDIKFESLIKGTKSNTTIVIVYIEGVAPESLVNFIKDAINKCQYEFILDTNYIQELFHNNTSTFDTTGYSEKPDVIASRIMEGRVGVIVDGAPFVISLPSFFLENFHTGDDYYTNKYFSNSTRILRWLAFFIAIFLVPVYIAVTTYHFSLIPSIFVFRLAVSRSGVPFPTIIEVILMITFFQIIREAGLRLPQPIGQAMSIVGALILGDAAIGAGLTSQTTVFIVALGSISFFLVPKLSGAMYLWSTVLILFGSLLGLPGFYIGFFMLVSHLSSLSSCGYPYLFPLGTFNTIKYRDTLIRKDLKKISNNLLQEEDE